MNESSFSPDLTSNPEPTMPITPESLAASFVISIITKNIPAIKDLAAAKELDRHIKKCYDSARKEWKCPAVREKYEGKEFVLLDELKEYVLGKNGELDEELEKLLARWARNMQKDPVCSKYISALKIDETFSNTKSNPVYFERIIEQMQNDSEQLSSIKESVSQQDAILKEIKQDGSTTVKTLESIERSINETKDILVTKLKEQDTPSNEDANLSSSCSELEDYLSQRLKDIREFHPSFKLMEIDPTLFPKGTRTLLNIKAINNAHEVKTVSEIVADSWKIRQNHLMIEGDGGIGKTVTLLSIPDSFVPHRVPAVYIQLRDLQETSDDETINDYLKSEVFSGREDLYDMFSRLANEPWIDGPRVLLLLDGFNEVIYDKREKLGGDIKRWAMNRRGVQIITTSRNNIGLFARIERGYSRIFLQPLGREVIKDFLSKKGLPYPKSANLWNIINHPLMLTLYCYLGDIKMLGDDSGLLEFRKNETVGAIIWNYLQRELSRYINQSEKSTMCVVATEFVAPYIAWQMTLKNDFDIDQKTFMSYVNDAREDFLKLGENSMPPHIGRILYNKDLPSFTQNQMARFLEEELCLIVNHGGRFTFMHQIFRDALAGIHLINVSYSSSGRPKEWEVPLGNDVLSYVDDLASEKEADKLWELNRSSDHNEVAMLNMLELQMRKRDYDFSSLSFKGLDLRNLSLLPYKDQRTSSLKFPNNPLKLDGLRVSKDTFESVEKSVPFINLCFYKLTPDGKKCVSGSDGNPLHVWDVESGRHLMTLSGNKSSFNHFDITPDGKKCVGLYNDESLFVWDLESGQILNTIALPAHTYSFRISPDGKTFTCCNTDNNLCAYNLESGRLISEMKGHTDWVRVVRFLPDNKRCVSGSDDHTIRVWEVETGVCINVLRGSEDFIYHLAIFDNGLKCVSSESESLRIWDLESGECLRVLGDHKLGFSRLVITPDEKKCLSFNSDGRMRIWDLKSGKCLHTTKNMHLELVDITVFYENGGKCVSGGIDGILRFWDIDSGECLKEIEDHSSAIDSIAIDSRELKCISASCGDTIRVWDLETKECSRVIETNKHSISSLKASSDGERCVSGSDELTLRVWNIKSRSISSVLIGHNGPISCFALTDGGKRCVSGARDKTIRVWDIESGNCIKVIEDARSDMLDLTVSSDGTKCVSTHRYGYPRFWDLESGEWRVMNEKRSVRDYYLTPDGKRGLGSTINHRLYYWDFDSGKCKLLSDHLSSSRLRPFFSSPYGRICVTIDSRNNDILCAWDLESGQCIATLPLERHEMIRSLAFCPDGKRCVLGMSYGTIHIWDMYSEQPVLSFNEHTRAVSSIAIPSDGRRFISASFDRTLRVWDLETGQCINVFDIPAGNPITYLAISNDGKFCICGSRDAIFILDLTKMIIDTINVLPFSLIGVNFSLSNIPREIKDTLKQNGAIV